MERSARAAQPADGTEDCLRVELAAVDTYDMVLEDAYRICRGLTRFMYSPVRTTFHA